MAKNVNWPPYPYPAKMPTVGEPGRRASPAVPIGEELALQNRPGESNRPDGNEPQIGRAS